MQQAVSFKRAVVIAKSGEMGVPIEVDQTPSMEDLMTAADEISQDAFGVTGKVVSGFDSQTMSVQFDWVS